MNERAVLYPRVSTDMQRDNFSIPSQIAECLQYANLKGYSIVGDRYVNPDNGYDTSVGNGAIPAFVDDFTSRELNRPGLDAALDYLDRVGYDVLVVHALDRLARDPYIRQTIEKEFIKRGARVEYVLGAYDETPEGEVRKDLDATFAKWENARRVERSTRGKKSKAQKGLFVGGRSPYGYTIDSSAPGGLAINVEQAEVVQKIFNWYASREMSYFKISRELEQRGIPSYTGGAKWYLSAIKNILKNPAYIGKVFYNKHKKRTNTSKVLRNREEWIEININPIIDTNLYNEVQLLIKEHRETLRRQPKHSYLLNRMVRCEECNHSYLSNFRNARPDENRNACASYRHLKSEGHCMTREVSARKLEPMVWKKICELLLDPEILRMGYNKALELQFLNQDRQRALKENLYHAVEKLELRLQNLTRAYTDPDIHMPKMEYLTQRKQIEAEMNSSGERIQEIESQLSDLPTLEEYETIEVFAEEIRKRIGENCLDIPLEEKRKILELLHAQVWIGHDFTVKVTGWFGETERVFYKSRSHSALQVPRRECIEIPAHPP